jgi:hypothetical protein
MLRIDKPNTPEFPTAKSTSICAELKFVPLIKLMK